MPTPRLRLLLIEDQSDLAANILDFFESLGHSVDYASDGASGISLALSESFDVVILDITLPRIDGWEVCRRIRSEAAVHLPLLMLTARDALDDKLRGFELGADDYLTKPFALDELHARCLALGRRRELQREQVIVIGTLAVDIRRRQAVRDGVVLGLTKKGFEILRVLAEAYPGAVTRSELVAQLWGDEGPDSDALRSHIYALRQVLDHGPAHPMLKTVHGVGFQLLADQ
jgi:DNA-binding response OmpR family regulator